ncbi:MAG: PAS domain S-box protein, partial [Gammaproteobacteria bacterium]|nr:PAS domain S-box protein [Gammaproteobacteria bacterium]
MVLHNRKWLEFYPWLTGVLQADSSLQGVQQANANHMTHEVSSKEAALDSDMDTSNHLEQLDDGRWFMASDNSTGDGGLACVRVDITEAKKTEFNLRKMERALEQSPASVVITNTEGIIEYVNPKFAQISGYSAEEAIGANPRILKSSNKSSDDYKDLWE